MLSDKIKELYKITNELGAVTQAASLQSTDILLVVLEK